ncbi:MAG: argininosuccinate synthase [Elusimicrobia bacterium]|nr:argininosuccinate synthase [Elusimicrobiota bacterium]
MEKILVAYSGGLDTSCMLRWLAEKYNAEVYGYCADVAGLVPSAKREIVRRGLAAGAKKVIIEDLRGEFLKDFVFPALEADAVYEGGYFLATALARPLIAKHLVEMAKKLKIKTVAHGCTGKGNDQVRFETSIYALSSNIKVLAPLRFWEFQTREDEVAYARAKKIPIETRSKKYSIDENVWGVAIECGSLEDPSVAPPADAWQMTASRPLGKERKIRISFRRGIPVSLNGKMVGSVELVSKLNRIAASYRIGRSDMVESRVVGIKSREIYEAPAAAILHAAHFDLERLILDKETLHYKEKVAKDYAWLVYSGRWFSPLREALDGFVSRSQEKITGEVSLLLKPNGFEIVGRTSPHSVYRRELATYSEGDEFNRNHAEGFIKLFSLDIAKKR